jgi:hypothetical protein
MEPREFAKKIDDLNERYGLKKAARDRFVIGSTVGSVTEGMRARFHEHVQFVLPELAAAGYFDRWHTANPGDTTRPGASSEYDVGLSLPVATDIWYLCVGESILPFKGDNYQENAAKILGFLSAYLTRLDNIKPLRSIQQYSQVNHIFPMWRDMIAAFEDVPNVIRTMRFETWMLNRSTEFPSKGPKASIETGVTSKTSTSLGQLYAGLLSFPVGPFGVMEVVSLFSESMDDMLKNEVPFTPDGTVAIENPEGWKCVTDQVGEGFMSPMTDLKGECPGVHLVEKGYVIVSLDAEYPAERFLGYDKILPQHSMRYYLRRDAKWPIPGEFIGMITKPFPTHIWWFQKTSPFLYAGNWIETNHYTSGIVTAILQPPEGSFGLVYRCVVRGVEVCIASSDFYGYAVGDRVAIIRLADLDRFLNTTKGNFKWKEMEDLIAREKWEKETPSNLPYIVNPNMMIVPMSFYKP